VKEWVGPVRMLVTVGWYVGLSLIVPVGIGYWLDQPNMLGKHPLFTLIGLGVGTVTAFVGLIQMLLRYQAGQEKVRKAEETKEKKQ